MDADLCFGFTKTRWEKLSQKLDGNDERAWVEAIEVLERRMNERFFSSIDALVAADTRPDAPSSDPSNTPPCIPGFSIMALCCLLIETLQGFQEGVVVPDPAGPCTFPTGPCIKPPPGTNQQFKNFLRRSAFGKRSKVASLACSCMVLGTASCRRPKRGSGLSGEMSQLARLQRQKGMVSL